ncbi:MAG: hypothetical protein ABI388_04900 [Bacteroidia bacterium]
MTYKVSKTFGATHTINPKRVLAKGYCLTKMANCCGPVVICYYAEAQLNRRVEFHFTIEKTIIIE